MEDEDKKIPEHSPGMKGLSKVASNATQSILHRLTLCFLCF